MSCKCRHQCDQTDCSCPSACDWCTHYDVPFDPYVDPASLTGCEGCE